MQRFVAIKPHKSRRRRRKKRPWEKKNLPVRSVLFPRSPTPRAGDAAARRSQDAASARCADIINEYVCLLPLLPLSS